MLNDQHLARGVFLAAIALAFGIGAMRYPIGDFSRAGPGLFPLMVSVLLLAVALVMIVSALIKRDGPKLDFNVRNIGLLLFSLALFALVSKVVDMVAGIAVMVFVAGLAASSYSWQRNVKIAAGLIAVAFAFQKGLGLNLPLI
jgi:hypothetical protein